MENVRYERLVEEAIGIKRRSRRDQGRLMLLIREVNDADRLKEFCEDINLTVPAAKNYLAAWDKAEEMGIVPGSGPGADEMIQEMWDLIFDPTLNDARYANVDREGVEAAAEEAGLQGPTKALDIAKNTKSMAVAIIGDSKCAAAAADAVMLAAKSDSDLYKRIEDEIIRNWNVERPGPRHPTEHNDDFFKGVFDKAKNAIRRSYDLDDLPEHLLGYAHGRALEIKTVASELVVVIEGRRLLVDINS
jgi:hypothetical protein